MTNTGIPYELLAQQIFQGIHDLHGVKTIRVQHNVQLEGITRDSDGRPVLHQIDVYWEFELAGIVYRAVIQAKDWGTSVPQGEVLKFKAVLADLPAQPRGIIVTRTGFQDGARRFAEAHGIELYELRRSSETDLQGRFRKIVLNLVMFSPTIEITNIEADQDWLSQRATGLEGRLLGGDANQTPLYDESGNPQNVTLGKVLHSHVPMEEVTDLQIRHVFESPTFLRTERNDLPFLKVDAISAKISTRKMETAVEHDYSNLLTYIVRAASGDKTYFVDEQMNVRKAHDAPRQA